MQDKHFPNGFASWIETHFEMSGAISKAVDIKGSAAAVKSEEYGTGGLYEMAEELTDQFEKEHEGEQWGGDSTYWEVLDEFIQENIYKQPIGDITPFGDFGPRG